MSGKLKWLASLFAGFVGLILVLSVVVYFQSEKQIHRTFEAPLQSVFIPPDSAALAQGVHLATNRCGFCHGPDLGGAVFIDNPVLGRMVPPNLTPGHAADSYSDEELARLIRFGVKRDGEGVLLMPAQAFYHLSDQDLGSIISHVRSIEPVERTLPGTNIGPLGRILLATGALVTEATRITPDMPRAESAPPGPTPEYGRYIAKTVCAACHGQKLQGGDSGAAEAPSLVIVNHYTFEQFQRLMREGITRVDNQISPNLMPWPMMEQFTDYEVAGLYAYLNKFSGHDESED